MIEMISRRNALIAVTAALLLFTPMLALCEVADASEVEIEEASDEKAGFKFGQQPEKNTLTVVVLIILTLILIVVLVLLLKLRKKMNDGHY